MTSTPASASTTKKSFFKKPTWATQAPVSESGDFFRHSDTVYDNILKEKERRRKKHAQKKQAKAGIAIADEGRDNKRRRISADDDDEEDGQSVSGTGSVDSRSEDLTKTEAEASENIPKARNLTAHSPRPSPSKPTLSCKPITSAPSQAIELGSDDETSQSHQPTAEGKVRSPRQDDEISDEDDEYVLELKQKAREKARLRKLGTGSANGQMQASRSPEPPQPQPVSSRNHLASPQRHAAPTPPPKRDEAIVQILITTKIPNAKPLLVNRKVSQSLQQVREVWCSRQNFDQDMTAKVIFTWREKRLYDTSTSTHLLNVLKKERARRMGGLAYDDEEDPSEGRIEVEAITKDMYEQRQLQRSREGKAADTDDAIDQDIQHDQSPERSSTPKQPEYTVVLKAQGFEQLQLKVRPSTAIAKIMAAFKKIRNLDPGKTCWLVHDGDRLEPESTVSDTEIEDGDAVEVHVR